MPNICAECDDGRWQCGDPNEICNLAGGWEYNGVAYVPTGMGSLAVAVRVYTRIVLDDDTNEPNCVVKLEHACLPDCSKKPEKPKRKAAKKKPVKAARKKPARKKTTRKK